MGRIASRMGWACALQVALVSGFVGLAVAQTVPNTAGDRDHLYAVKLHGDHLAWAVGAFGTVLHSADGGKTWTRQETPTTEPLFDIDFVNSDHGWVVGRSGLVLATSNGGKTWSRQNSGTDKHLLAIDCVDTMRCFAVGDWGAIITTADGGVTWQTRELSSDLILNDVSMLDEKRGWIVGEAGTMLATEDGGATWAAHDPGVGKSLFAIHFANPQQGWAVGIDALVLATDDGGATWHVQHGTVEFGALDQTGFAQVFDSPPLYAVSVAGQVGFAIGDMGAVLASSDGGRTWERQQIPGEVGLQWFRGMDLQPQANGMIVGAGGLRMAIRNGRIEIPKQ